MENKEVENNKFNFQKFKDHVEWFLLIWFGLVLLAVLVTSFVIAINTGQQIHTIWVDLFKELLHTHPASIIKFLAGAGLFGGYIWLVLIKD